MKLRRYRSRLPFWAIADAPVWYSPRPGETFAAIIEAPPWLAIGKATWMAALRDVDVPGAGGLMRISSVEVGQLSPRLVVKEALP